MTNTWSIEHLVAKAWWDKNKTDSRHWHDLSPYEQNKIRTEAKTWIEAVKLINPSMIKKKK